MPFISPYVILMIFSTFIAFTLAVSDYVVAH
nr:MAG TPA: hypothetical protein [Caudoviricetes sp.]